MANYYESDYATRGIDYDLHACLEYNPQDGFTVDDIDRVLAVHEGQNDEDDWRWILRLKDGRFVFLQGGCDYTGWDCQSSASSKIVDAVAEAIAAAREGNPAAIITSLAKQLLDGKHVTWREGMDKEFGL